MTSIDVVLCSPVRTAIGTYNGSLRNTPATELGAVVITETVARAGLKPELVDNVVMGNVVQAGNRMNPARQAAIHGGLPVTVPAMTVNRVCGSGAQAVITAALEVWLGRHKVAVAGGMENMDRAPYLMESGRWGYRMGKAEIYDSMLYDGLEDAFSGKHSGWHTEDLVALLQISRSEQDIWALHSQERFVAARAQGWFDKEIVPVMVTKRKSETEQFRLDEAPRPETTFEALAKLRPAFRPEGTITAGNSPGLNSGAAAMIVADRAFAEAQGIEPMGRIAGYGVAAVEPGMFGLGPVAAVHEAVQRAGWQLPDVERVEINEAYAAIALAVTRKLGLPQNIVNVDGGAVAHGHPIGATGAVLITRILHSMRRDGLRRGLVTLCIGGGQGVALALEAI